MPEPEPDSSTPGCRVHLVTFGCQMNRADSTALRPLLRRAGYQPAGADDADWIVFNTCAVRQGAEDRVHGRLASLRPVKARRRDLRIAVIGCMAQRLGDELVSRHPHVDLVVGTDHLDRLPELLAAARASGPVVALERREWPGLSWRGEADGVTAWIPAMRGCDHRCTYCVVPDTRGPARSRAPALIEEEARRALEAGFPQICLLGQIVDAYGRDLEPAQDLTGLLRRLHELPGLERLRFVTSHPRFLDDGLLAAMAELPKVARHLHVPAQSGSDRVLRRMGRGYSAADYRGLLARTRDRLGEVDVQSDFIVGFPGETDADHRATVELVEEARFCGAFVFMYSPRPATPAARLPDDVPAEVKRERCRDLQRRQLAIQEADHRALRGRVLRVLLEGPSKTRDDRLQGRSNGHRNVIVPRADAAGRGRDHLIGRVVPVRIADATDLSLFGDVSDAAPQAPHHPKSGSSTASSDHPPQSLFQ